MTREAFEFFWGGPFSQWYKCQLIIDGVSYNCAEQYMMAMKAHFFGDMQTHALIMQEKNQRKQKALGRLVKNFDQEAWLGVAQKFVYKANKVKFSDPMLQQLLLNTGNKIIAEASPEDALWGIGLTVDNPACLDQAQWGKNWLGTILMQIRQELVNMR